MKQRDSGIELFRLILAFLVVVIHILTFRDIVNIANINLASVLTPHMIVLRIISSSAVNGFIFISGYYGIKFKIKGLWSLYENGVFYGFWGAMLLYLFCNGSPRYLISSFMPITRGSWWFLSSYCLVYLVSPIINNGINSLSKKDMRLVLIGLFVATSICSIWGARDRFGGSFLLLLTLYVLGRYMAIYKILIKKAYIYWALLVLFLFIVFYIFVSFIPHYLDYLLCYNSIFVIIQAVLMFYTFKNLNIKQSLLINRCSSYSFQMYLFGGLPVITNILYSKDFVLFIWGGDFVGVLISVFIVFLLCIAVEECHRKIKLSLIWIVEKTVLTT